MKKKSPKKTMTKKKYMFNYLSEYIINFFMENKNILINTEYKGYSGHNTRDIIYISVRKLKKKQRNEKS